MTNCDAPHHQSKYSHVSCDIIDCPSWPPHSRSFQTDVCPRAFLCLCVCLSAQKKLHITRYVLAHSVLESDHILVACGLSFDLEGYFIVSTPHPTHCVGDNDFQRIEDWDIVSIQDAPSKIFKSQDCKMVAQRIVFP